jgi:catechol 2,3-dioxygenase-like lactoylglutathione lyase family enzyme
MQRRKSHPVYYRRQRLMAFAHITLAVRDVARSTRFFEATLGWRPIGRPVNNAQPASWLVMGDGQELHLVQVPDFEPSPFEREYGRHLAVSYPRAGFDDLEKRLNDHEAEVLPAERATPFARFFFRSPDGYIFEVVEEERTPDALTTP